MKKILYLVYMSLRGNLKINIALFLQLLIAIVCLNISFGAIRNTNSVELFIKNSGIIEDIYYYPYAHSLNSSDLEHLKDTLMGTGYFEGIGSIFKLGVSSLNSNDRYYDAYSYSKELLNEIRLPVQNGKWFETDEAYDNSNPVITIPAVISSNLSNQHEVGDEVQANLLYTTSTGQKSIDANIKIIGVLKRDIFIYSFSGNSIDNFLNSNFNGFILPDINDYIAGESIQPSMPGLLLFVNKSLGNNKIIDSLNKKFDDFNVFCIVQQMVDDQKKQSSGIIYYFTIIGVFVLLLTIAGLGGNNMINNIFEEKTFSIYYICGMGWERCILIILIKDLIKIVLPGIIAFFILFVLVRDMISSFVTIDILQFIVTILFCISIYFITSFQVMHAMLKKQPIDIIRGWE